MDELPYDTQFNPEEVLAEPQPFSERLKKLADNFNKISSLKDFIAHEWFLKPDGFEQRIAPLYITGRYEQAEEQLTQICNFFERRRLLQDREWWIKEFNLYKLNS